MAYDTLLLALGARAEEAVPGALTFRGPEDSARLRAALEHLHAGEPLRVAFVAAAGTAWTLPLYELALMTARWADERGLAIEPWVVTWEHRPLIVFGEDAASSVAELLADAGVRLWTGAFADAVEDGRLWISIEGGLPVDLAVALPRPIGPAIPGLPADAHGFVPVDEYGRVPGARRRLRGRRHDHAAAEAGRAWRRSRRTSPPPRSPPPPGADVGARGLPPGAARDAARPAAARATCATPAATTASPPTTRPGGRRTRSRAASSRPT